MKTVSYFAGVLCCFLVAAGPLPAEHNAAAKKTPHILAPQDHNMLRKHLDESVLRGEVPGGALLLVHEGQTVFKDGFGFRHIKHGKPFTADTPFHVASISKPIIATLVVKLAAERRLDLDRPIDAYLHEMSDLVLESGERPVTIPTLRQCLSHTAGFRSDYDEGGRPWLRLRGQGMTLADAVTDEAKIPMPIHPGTEFAYSGIGYDIAGRIVELSTGSSLETAIQTELFEPLGMTQTTYYPDEETAEQMADFYWLWRSDGKFRRKLPPPLIPAGKYKSVGGGIVSTLDDLNKFMLLHQNHGVHDGKPFIPRDAIEQMYRGDRPGKFYGLGFMLKSTGKDGLANQISHSGSSGTLMWLDRQRQSIGVLATQHRFSDGKKMPESQKRIPADAPTWQATTKKEVLDPVMDRLQKSNERLVGAPQRKP
ncbi:serine hydrolase domain-containing protein [Novipirellula sp.]|uniref:serine hydrolase domain-containing protein n=1 Tax=Novipirellula sp. TaxID=2795430 RepID=UPI00356AE9AF